MSYKVLVINQIQVIGKIWQPMTGVCAMTYSLNTHDIENICSLGNGKFNRDGVQRWLDTNAGDFESIIDFHADIGDFDSPWESEDSEFVFLDCMYPAEV